MPTDDALEFALEVLGLDPALKGQLGVMAEALSIHQQREETHGALWEEHGHIDSAGHIRSKGSRVVRGTAEYDKELALGVRDDALDLINYACFWVRNVDEDRLGEAVDPE